MEAEKVLICTDGMLYEFARISTDLPGSADAWIDAENVKLDFEFTDLHGAARKLPT